MVGSEESWRRRRLRHLEALTVRNVFSPKLCDPTICCYVLRILIGEGPRAGQHLYTSEPVAADITLEWSLASLEDKVSRDASLRACDIRSLRVQLYSIITGDGYALKSLPTDASTLADQLCQALPGYVEQTKAKCSLPVSRVEGHHHSCDQRQGSSNDISLKIVVNGDECVTCLVVTPAIHESQHELPKLSLKPPKPSHKKWLTPFASESNQQTAHNSHGQMDAKKGLCSNSAEMMAQAEQRLKQNVDHTNPVVKVLDFVVHLDELVPLDREEVRSGWGGVNQVLLRLPWGYFAPPSCPPPSSWRGSPSQALEAGAQHKHTLAQQQQLFRWMLSTGSIVQPLGADDDGDDDGDGAAAEPPASSLLLDRAASSLLAPLNDLQGVGSVSLITTMISMLFGQEQPPPKPPRSLPPSSSSSNLETYGSAPHPSTSQSHTPPTHRRAGSHSSTASDPAGCTSTSWGGAPPAIPAPWSPDPGALHPGRVSQPRCVERWYDVQEMRGEIRKMSVAQQRLDVVRERRVRVQGRLEALMSQHEAERQRRLSLEAAQRDSAAAARHVAALTRRLQRLRFEAVQQRLRLTARAQALVAASGLMKSSVLRLRDAEGRLAGPEGCGRWKALHAQLVARVNRLVCGALRCREVGPLVRPGGGRQALDARLDSTWWCGGDLECEEEAWEEWSRTSLKAAAFSPNMKPLGPQPTRPRTSPSPPLSLPAPQSGGTAASAVAAALSRTPASSSRTPASSSGTATVRLAISGLELHPSLAKRGLEGVVGWNNGDEEQRVAAALGYVAHTVQQLSAYLDVPLRYPLIPASSRSFICDPCPNARGAAPHSHSVLGWDWSMAAASSGSAAGRRLNGVAAREAEPAPVQLPLFYDGWDRTRFAYAIFLLNKDIEQLLQAHGLSSAGPNQLLQNLYKLMAAAAAAIQP